MDGNVGESGVGESGVWGLFLYSQCGTHPKYATFYPANIYFTVDVQRYIDIWRIVFTQNTVKT